MTELWYRFNVFAERRFFEDSRLIDGLVVPAHVIAYYEISFPQFLKEAGLPFIIDPISYVWDITHRFLEKDGELKKSYGKLVEKLGCKIGDLLGKHRLSRVSFSNADFEDFINSIMNFQLLNFGSKKPQRQQSLQRLKERIRLVEGEPATVEETKVQPYALIPPYFYFTNVGDEAYERTLYAAQFAKDSQFGNEHKIFPCLCMNRSILQDAAQMAKILTDFQAYQGIVFWISGFEENSASLAELESLARFIHNLSSQGSEVMNLYGGYFSLALHHAGLSKMSCGICYSSAKNVFSEATGGGLPIRYYEPTLKLKIMSDIMFKLYSDKPELFICDCPICSEHANQCRNKENEREQLLQRFFIDNKITNEKCTVDWESSRLHFLHCRKTEQQNLVRSSISETINGLSSKYNQLHSEGFDPHQYGLGSESLTRFRDWAHALRKIK
jgi:hypothetical protein